MTVINRVSYLRTSREFPEEMHELTVQMNRAYGDIAAAVNVRTIGIFPINRPAITGEGWYYEAQKQQTLRQIFTFTTTGNFVHGIKFTTYPTVVRAFGYYTDGQNAYGVIYGSNVAIAGQVSFYVTPSSIFILSGTGAPVISSGTVVIEWLSNI
jgi:hypothetical protein